MARLPGPRSPVKMLRLAIGMQRRLGPTLEHLAARYGPVCEFGAGPFRYVYAFGREANEHILSTEPDAFSWGPAMQLLVPVDGPTALVVSDGDDHKRRRRLVQPAFHKRRIDGYLGVIHEEVDRTIDGWTAGSTIDAYDELRQSIRRIVIRSLFGERLRERADEIGGHLEAALRFVDMNPVLQWRIDRPGFPYRRAMRAKERADEIVFAEIAHRRAHPDEQGDDVLSWLVEAAEGDDRLSDLEIRDQVVSLVAAGYETTSAAAGWAVHDILTRPAVEERLRGEIDAVLGPRTLEIEDIRNMSYLDATVSEVLRLHSPAIVAGRRVERDVELLGFTIPAGKMLLYSAWVTHRDPGLWPDPERFEPGRWIEGDPAHHEIQPYSWVPFGGGYRRCIGFALATLELQAITARVLQRTRLRAVRHEIEPTGIASLAPKGGVEVVVEAVHPVGVG